MQVTVFNDQDDLSLSQQSVVSCVQEILKPVSYQEVIVHFVSKETIKKLHKEHFNDESSTDCITLPIDPPGPECEILGEVFVCPKVALEYANENGLDPYQECTLYVIHGLLHLIGFADLEEDEIVKMREMESHCLNLLSQENLILTPAKG